MSYTDRATAALRASEKELRSILTEAVLAEAYKDVASLARTAEALANLIREFGTEAEIADGPPSTVKLVGPAWPDAVRASETEAATVLLRRRPSMGPPRRDQFPQFLRDGNRLVKLAWSKKERGPYEHRAPREAIQILIAAIHKKKGEGKLFQASDVMPIKNSLHEEFPSYQSYLALAWLRDAGVITKKGRDGYVLKPKASTPEKLEQLWVALPEAQSAGVAS